VILIVGLGNPGSRYEATRHNVGFRIVDRWVNRQRQQVWREKFEGQFASINRANGERVILLKPMTFMNLSGFSVRAASSFFKLEPAEILVVHDELDLPFGEFRLKLGGGDAGHNGIGSIIEQMGTDAFARLRFGIGRPPADFVGSGADFVLEGFPPADCSQVEELIDAASKVLDQVIDNGLSSAMNVSNRKKKKDG
jgi:PTH1 family peptidyl-tRNA hydrolase